MSLTFVQGDTDPDITSIIHLEDDVATVIDLTSCSVKFQMRKPDDRRFTVDAGAQILNPTAGSVSYSWGPNDLSVPGTYQAQWEVTYPGGRRQTTAPVVEIIVRRQ